MSFAHPMLAWIAVGVLGLPPLIHWLCRFKARRMPWAAMQFLRSAQRADTTRRRFERWMLMLLRMVALGCVGFAIARPRVSSVGTVWAAGADRHLVMLIDDSLSMVAPYDDARSRFDVARAVAAELLQQRRAAAPVSILTSTGTTPIVEHTIDPHRAGAALDSLTAGAKHSDWPAVFASAGRVIQRHGVAGVRLVVLTDCAAVDWTGADGQPAPAVRALRGLPLAMTPVVVHCGSETANVAVVWLRIKPRSVGPADAATCAVTVANYGSAPSPPTHVDLLDHQRVIGHLEVSSLAAGESSVLTAFVAPASVQSGVLTARVTAPPGDAVQADDVRRVTVASAAGARALIITGVDPDTPGSAVQYLTAALAPRRTADHARRWTVSAVTPDALGAEIIDDHDLLIVSDVARLGAATWQRIEGYVRGGGGLWVIPGDRTDAADYNTAGYRDGHGVLAGSLGEAVDIRPPADAPGIAIASLRRGPVARLAAFPQASLFRARVHRYLALDASQVDHAILLTNGAPLWVARRVGGGRSALLATAADMTWGNLPAKGDFVSLVHEIADWLRRDVDRHNRVYAGQPYARRMTAGQARATPWVDLPDGRVLPAVVDRSVTPAMVRAPNTDLLGVYRMGAVGAKTAFVVNVDPRECDPRSTAPVGMADALGQDVKLISDPRSILRHSRGGDGSKTAAILAYAGLLVLLGESLMSARVNRAQDGNERAVHMAV